jgi:hypothetical protein
MGEGLKRRVESIKQQAQDIALNVRDLFKEKVSGNVRFMLFQETMTSELFIKFPARLIDCPSGLVMGGGPGIPVQRSGCIGPSLKRSLGSRLRLHDTPQPGFRKT